MLIALFTSALEALSLSKLPMETRPVLFDAVASFQNIRFLWKWEGEIPIDMPKSALAKNWFPQQDVRANHKCKGFATPDGAMIFSQSIYSAVRMIVVLGFGNQLFVAKYFQHLGTGVHLEISDITKDTFSGAIRQTLDLKYPNKRPAMDTNDCEYVISGMSGRFPESNDLDTFWENLLHSVDLVSDDSRRWNVDSYDMPRHMGKILDLDKFDADFFHVSGKQADLFDPRLRKIPFWVFPEQFVCPGISKPSSLVFVLGKLLELTYEAIVDAGISPKSLYGTQTGVFISATNAEALEILLRSEQDPPGYLTLCTSQCMLANRISFAFDFKSVSLLLDTACSGSLVALNQAIISLRVGACEYAIVGSANIMLFPGPTASLANLNVLSRSGKCKAFDADCDGMTRSEACVVIFLCRKTLAKRCYAKVAGIRCNHDGYKSDGVSFPARKMQEELLNELYMEIGVDPLDVKYVECHGTSTKAGDPQELNALAEVFCKGRKGPLLVGSVKSVMGHAESASGLCGVVKVILARQAGVIPPNLHFKVPNPNIPPLVDGFIQVVTNKTKFESKYVGISSFGIGGTIAHVVLKFETNSIDGCEDLAPNDNSAPKIVFASGRTQNAVSYVLQNAIRHSKNAEFLRLLQEVTIRRTPNHPFVGYTILESADNGSQTVVELLKRKDPKIWFAFSGLGIGWSIMCEDMMKFKAFCNSVQASTKVLQQNGVDTFSLRGAPDETIIFTSVTMIQIALTDLLSSLNLHPDGIIGYSMGEYASGYADMCLTREQSLLVSLSVARALLESNLPPAKLADVQMTWEDALHQCPQGIVPVFHNGQTAITVTGPPDIVTEFIRDCKAHDRFLGKASCTINVLHSTYALRLKPLLGRLLKAIIPHPKPRCPMWVSSCTPADKLSNDVVRLCSAAYFVVHALSPVYLYAAVSHIPSNAVVLDVGADCAFKPILKTCLGSGTDCVSLMVKGNRKNCMNFLKSLGQMYISGLNMEVGALYSPVKFPICKPLPCISSLIKWDHSRVWGVPDYKQSLPIQGITYSINTAVDGFYAGHALNGRIVFPAAGYIWLVWKMFARRQNERLDQLAISLENVYFNRTTDLVLNKSTKFKLSISNDGHFTVSESDEIVCVGTIRKLTTEYPEQELFPTQQSMDNDDNVLDQQDFYKLMGIAGYEYEGMFQGVLSTDAEGGWAKLLWQGNWICFLDSIFQVAILYSGQSQDTVLPVRLENAIIDPNVFMTSLPQTNIVALHNWEYFDTFRCSGVQLSGIKVSSSNQNQDKVTPALEEQQFEPYVTVSSPSSNPDSVLDFLVQVAYENTLSPSFIMTQVLRNPDTGIFEPKIFSRDGFHMQEYRAVSLIPDISMGENPHIQYFGSIKALEGLSKSHLLFLDNFETIHACDNIVSEDAYVIIKSRTCEFELQSGEIISQKKTKSAVFTLFRKNAVPKIALASVISIDSPDYQWVDILKRELDTVSKDRKLIVSKDPVSGIIGFMKSLLKEVSGPQLRCYLVFGRPSIALDLDNFERHEILSKQVNKDLVYNVYKHGLWGCYGHFRMAKSQVQQCAKPKMHIYADIANLGDLSTLRWVEGPLFPHTRTEQCRTFYSGLNFRDVLYCTGNLPKSSFSKEQRNLPSLIGYEFAGIYAGRRVCGWSTSGCLASQVNIQQQCWSWRVPNNWSLLEAATVPVAYVTAICSLIHQANIQSGECILIHSGSGSVGLAAITLAQMLGCCVYTTVGSDEKKAFLKSCFPKLKDQNIKNSRNAHILDRQVLTETKGKGVNVILNSLTGSGFHASIQCLSRYGRFIEIGKHDSLRNTKIGSAFLAKGARVEGVHLDMIVNDPKTLEQLAQSMERLNGLGFIHPLPFACFGKNQLEDAFRKQASRDHVGKVIVRIWDTSDKDSVQVIPMSYFREDKTYVVIGGLGGMGLEMLDWMVERGARRVFIVSRSGITTSYQRYMVNKWQKLNCQVHLRTTDVSSRNAIRTLLIESDGKGCIDGIFNMALVLEDRCFENHTPASFQSTLTCKVASTIHFDELTREMFPKMEYFVVFSSQVAVRGNFGQTSYAYANSAMERICERRKSLGHNALAIQWGSVGNVGAIAKTLGKNKSFLGTKVQPILSCIETLDVLLQHSGTVMGSFMAENNVLALEIIPEASLSDAVCRILGIESVSAVDESAMLEELGFDSLNATEIRHVTALKTRLSLRTNVIGKLTFADLLAIDANASALPDHLTCRLSDSETAT